MSPKPGPLADMIGLFFHAFVDKRVSWQGRIVSSPQPGFYLVEFELADRALGDTKWFRLVPIDGMTAWQFYLDADEMNRAKDMLATWTWRI
jgi:hypothetical protein